MTSPTITLHDPTSEADPVSRPRLTPPESLEGRTVALFDIGKIRSDEFLDTVEHELAQRGINTLRVAKPTNAKPAPTEAIHAVVEGADVAVVALAD